MSHIPREERVTVLGSEPHLFHLAIVHDFHRFSDHCHNFHWSMIRINFRTVLGGEPHQRI